MRSLIVAGVSIAAAGSAAADPGIRFGGELGASYPERDDLASELTWVAPQAAIRVAYGDADGLSVGLRVAVSRLGFDVDHVDSTGSYPSDRYRIVPIDVAATAQYVLGRQWVAPWLGWRFTRLSHQLATKFVDEPGRVDLGEAKPTEWQSSSLVTGLSGGYDLWVHGADRVGAFAELAVGARAAADADRYISVAAGVAYRR